MLAFSMRCPTIGYLYGLRPAPRCRPAVSATPITGDDPDGWAIGEPCLDRRHFPIREQINNAALLQITNDRAVAMPPLPGLIIDAHDIRAAWRLGCMKPHNPQQRILAEGEQKTAGKALSRAAAKCQAEMPRQIFKP